MRQNMRNYIFVAFLALVGISNSIMPDLITSESERRLLTQWEDVNANNFESYFLDQFVFRDSLRTIKSFVDFYVFQKKDIHDVYIHGEHAFLIHKTLDEQSTIRFTNYALNLAKLLPETSPFVLGIIPDKSYYSEKKGYPTFDYNTMKELISKGLNDSQESTLTLLDFSSLLDLDDYYKTDLHWKQESIEKVKDKILETFNHGQYTSVETYSLKNDFEAIFYPDFYGGYFSRAPLFLSKETLTYYTSDLTESSMVEIYETLDNPTLFEGVYNPNALGKMDSYDVFLYGAKSLITIDTQKEQDRHLLLFRDSFASSLTPLLLNYYDTITLIDLRYISPTLALKMIGPLSDNTDILMLYNTQIINNSLLLKPM